MNEKSNWQKEHPDSYDPAIEAELLEMGWYDASWHNDVSASFDRVLADGRIIRIWITPLDPALREDANMRRFQVNTYTEEYDPILNSRVAIELYCEEWKPVKAFLQALRYFVDMCPS